MDYTDLTKKARQLIKNAGPEVQTQLDVLLKKYGAKTKILEFQIYIDAFEVVAYIGRQEAWPDNVQFKKQPFVTVSGLLENLPEQSTHEGSQRLEQVFAEIYQFMFDSMVEAWARLKSKPNLEAYVRQSDGSEAIELASGKKVAVNRYESRLYYLRPEPKKIEYPPISDTEKSGLPKLFVKPTAKMSDEDIKKGIELYFEFVKSELARISPLLNGIFKNVINQHTPELKKARFIDIKVEEPHLFVAAVPKGFKDEMHIPLGFEVDLSRENPLRRFDAFVVETNSRLSFDSEVERDILFAIGDLRTECGLRLNVKRAWDKAAQGSALPAAFVRSQAMNRWLNPDDFNRDFSLDEVMALSKAKPKIKK